MKVYLDILFLINFFCDFLILYSVSILLKRNVKIRRIILSSLFGSISIIVLFIKINSFILFLIKIVFASIMVIISFGYKDFKYFINNLVFFFLNSLLLGGFIYLINLKIKNNVINSLFGNIILLLIFSPLIVYLYTKYLLKLKNNYSLKYKIDIYIKGHIINLCGYYDTGSVLKDPYKNRPIIVVNNKYFKDINLNYLLVPCETVNNKFLMKCFKPDNVYIKGLGNIENVLIGLTKDSINIEGVDCLINKNILEGYNGNIKNNKKIIK